MACSIRGEGVCAGLDLGSNRITDEGVATIVHLLRDSKVSAAAG